MRMVGARFDDENDAHRALDELRTRFQLADADAGVRPLGTTAYDEPADAALLAGRFWPDRVAAVSDIVTEHGGEVVVDEDEDRLG